MKMKKINSILLSLFSTSYLFAQELDWLRFSGFTTIAATYNDNKEINFRSDALSSKGSKGDISHAPDSKIGLRLDATLHEKISASVQGMLSTQRNKTKDLKLEWANVKFQLNNNYSFELGRLRAPIYMYSDILNVSYAYHWIRLPQEVYTPIPFSSYNGAKFNFEHNGKNFNLHTSIIYGNEKQKLVTDPDGSANTTFKTDHLKGVSSTLTSGEIKVRASYFETKLTMQNDGLKTLYAYLTTNGFTTIANDLDINNKKVKVTTLGFSYENTSFFLNGEYIDIQSKSWLGDIAAYYLSAGYILDSFTPFVTVASSKQDNTYPQTSTLPGALQTPVEGTLSGMNLAQKSYTLGVRYDLFESASLKVQFDKIKVDTTHQTIHMRYNNNLDDMNVISLALDMVF